MHGSCTAARVFRDASRKQPRTERRSLPQLIAKVYSLSSIARLLCLFDEPGPIPPQKPLQGTKRCLVLAQRPARTAKDLGGTPRPLCAQHQCAHKHVGTLLRTACQAVHQHTTNAIFWHSAWPSSATIPIVVSFHAESTCATRAKPRLSDFHHFVPSSPNAL